MAYCLSSLTLRTDNSPEGLSKINALWADITSGALPLLFDSEKKPLPGISPVSRYSAYASDEKGAYDLSILAVTSDFFARMESDVRRGLYVKYDEAGDDISACVTRAWGEVWRAQNAGEIHRSFTEDFESTVPAQYTKDGKAHCYLYIAVGDR